MHFHRVHTMLHSSGVLLASTSGITVEKLIFYSIIRLWNEYKSFLLGIAYQKSHSLSVSQSVGNATNLFLSRYNSVASWTEGNPLATGITRSQKWDVTPAKGIQLRTCAWRSKWSKTEIVRRNMCRMRWTQNGFGQLIHCMGQMNTIHLVHLFAVDHSTKDSSSEAVNCMCCVQHMAVIAHCTHKIQLTKPCTISTLIRGPLYFWLV